MLLSDKDVAVLTKAIIQDRGIKRRAVSYSRTLSIGRAVTAFGGILVMNDALLGQPLMTAGVLAVVYGAVVRKRNIRQLRTLPGPELDASTLCFLNANTELITMRVLERMLRHEGGGHIRAGHLVRMLHSHFGAEENLYSSPKFRCKSLA